jgi:hypothetical protein
MVPKSVAQAAIGFQAPTRQPGEERPFFDAARQTAHFEMELFAIKERLVQQTLASICHSWIIHTGIRSGGVRSAWTRWCSCEPRPIQCQVWHKRRLPHHCGLGSCARHGSGGSRLLDRANRWDLRQSRRAGDPQSEYYANDVQRNRRDHLTIIPFGILHYNGANTLVVYNDEIGGESCASPVQTSFRALRSRSRKNSSVSSNPPRFCLRPQGISRRTAGVARTPSRKARRRSSSMWMISIE